MKCNQCTQWEPNIKLVNAPNSLLFARNPTTYKGYTGAQFRYCPWCGNRLVPDEQQVSESDA